MPESMRVFRSAYGDVCVIERCEDGTYECRIDWGSMGVERKRLGSFEAARRYMRQDVRDWVEV